MPDGRSSVPNPGSREALDQGCICPVMDNWRGSDEIGRIRGFIMVEGCPLHWRPTERELELDAQGAEIGWDGARTAAERGIADSGLSIRSSAQSETSSD